jgi:hypothetical protein
MGRLVTHFANRVHDKDYDNMTPVTTVPVDEAQQPSSEWRSSIAPASRHLRFRAATYARRTTASDNLLEPAGTERCQEGLRFCQSEKEQKSMGILGNIMSAIFKPATPGATAGPGASPPTQPASSGAATAERVDVAAVLTKLAAQNKEKLDWKRSIVDMMKLLNLDSSLTARKQLAQELHFTGDMNDSASMNIWLHGQVMKKLAENGGKVPADLIAK